MTCFYGPLHMDVPVVANQQELIYISSERTQYVIWKTCRGRWIKRTDRERKSQGNPYYQRDLMMIMVNFFLSSEICRSFETMDLRLDFGTDLAKDTWWTRSWSCSRSPLFTALMLSKGKAWFYTICYQYIYLI